MRLTVERVVAGGDGFAHDADGRVVFVPGALPGETVDVEIESAKRDFARARLLDVAVASPARRPAPCSMLARGCGGCDWQHVDPVAQLELKASIVADALRRTARLQEANVVAGGRVPADAYRTSMRLVVDRSGRAGLREGRSHRCVPLDECLVAHPLLERLVRDVRVPGATEISLRVSAATGESTAWWTPARRRATGLAADTATGPRASLIEVVDGAAPLRVRAASFFQSGPDAADLLVHTVRATATDELAAARHVVDAYGGVGLFAATVPASGARVTLVESSASAVADARVNLAGRDAEVVESTVEEWTPSVADVVVADPARRGLGADAAAGLAGTRAPTLVLVSCDPVSLARDVALLADHGYEHVVTHVLDLFPHTHHVEAVTKFSRRA